MSMFEGRVEDITLLRDSIAAIADLIDEAELHITYDGIRVASTDRTVVVVVDFFLHAKAFGEYVFSQETRVGLNLLNLVQILRRAKPEDAVTFKVSDKKIEVVLESDTVRVFHLPVISITKTDIPQLDKIEAGFTAFFDVATDVLCSGIEDAELVGDSVIFTLRKDGMTMNADSDASAAQLDLKAGDKLVIREVASPVRARYSLDYLKKILKARRLADRASLAMATDYPLKLVFDVPEKVRLGFILAPRVEES